MRTLLRRRPRTSAPRLRLRAGAVLAVVLVGAAVVPMALGSAVADPAHRLLPVGSPGHPLGTDQLGRDLLGRMLTSLRWSLAVGFVATLVVSVVGTAVGVLAGSSRGVVRAVLSRLIDVSLAFPYLVLAITVMAVVGRGFLPLSLTLGLVSWPLFARVVYAETLSQMERGYVLAARLSGVRQARTVCTHVLPGVRTSMLVMFAFMFADLLVAESGLSFLGIGAPLGAPSLGNMLAEGRQYLVQAPTMVIVPSAAIVIAVVAANLLGDGLAGRVPK